MKKEQAIRSSVRRELGLGRPARASVRVLAISGFLWSLEAAAQPPYRQEILPGVSSLALGETHSRPRSVDLDGDGDADLVAGDGAGKLHYFENVSAGAEPEFVSVPVSSNPFAGIDVGDGCDPLLADLDFDGDLDLAAGNSLGTVRYFENTGGSAAPAFTEILGEDNPFAAVPPGNGVIRLELGDLDGDGDLDLAVRNIMHDFRYYANTGSITSPAFVSRTGSANPLTGANLSPSGVAFDLADLDGDGDLDLTMGSNLDVFYARNTGSSAAPAFAVVTGSANPFAAVVMESVTAPELADLDGDGDLDAILGNPWGTFDTLLNTGSATVPAFVAAGGADKLAGLDAGASIAPDFVDLDGDGDRDMVTTTQDRVLRYYRNTGTLHSPGFVAQTGPADPFSGVGDLNNLPLADLADLDGDSDLDVLVGNYQNEMAGFTILVRNTGTPSAPGFVRGSANQVLSGGSTWFYTRTTPELADLDGDGDPDLVMALTSEIKYYKNTGTPTAPDLTLQNSSANPFAGLTAAYTTYPELADYDGDGDFDMPFAKPGGSMGLLENTGSASVPAFVNRSGATNPLADVAPGIGGLWDLDGDGDLDFLLSTLGGRLVFYRSGAVLFSDGFEGGDLGAWSFFVN